MAQAFMRLAGRWLLSALLAAAALGGCASLPPGSDYPKRTSVAFAQPEATQIGRTLAAAARDHPGESAFRIISVGVDGFAARMQLIEVAERALDLQYFIFRQDDTGRLLTDALLRAADRGVRLRVLVDDGATASGDHQIRLLAAHPQIEVRIFNPFAYRGDSKVLRVIEFIFGHHRLNFRMHNKLLVADNASALIGGRNIGDQYFQVDPEGQYADDDVLVGGPAVQQLSAKFDDYWNSALAIPVEALAGGRPAEAQLAGYRRRLAGERAQAQHDNVAYLQRAASGDPLSGVLSGQLPLVWAGAQVVCDSPEKRRVKEGTMVGRLMYEPVARTAAAAGSELLMITPYYIPTPEERQLLQVLRQRGVRVRVLTNSLESTTELAAHSGYARLRPALVRSGVELHELRALLGNTRGSGQTVKMSRHGNYGLHAKLFVFDRQKLFIGSMNFDQRSVRLNSEVGLIIDSAELSQQTASRFEAMTQPANAYEVLMRVDAAGRQRLVWRTEEAGKSVEYAREPSPSRWRRFVVALLSLFPLDRSL